MADKDILEQIKKKSDEISSSNKELAERMDKNKELITRFSDELEALKRDMTKTGMDSNARERLEMLKSELEDKKEVIRGLINQLRPLEIDVATRENLDGGLKQMIAEKDAMLKVLKDKLNEKTSLVKRLESENSVLKNDVDAMRKQVFGLENKAGAVEKRVFATNEQNQRLLYEVMQFKEKLTSTERMLDERDRLIASKDAEHAKALESLRASEENKRVIIMKGHTKKMAVMNATISTLKAKLEKQQELIDQKSQKERMLMVEFSKGMKELMSQKVDTSIDLKSVEEAMKIPDIDDSALKEMEDSTEQFNIPSPEEAESSYQTTGSGSEVSNVKMEDNSSGESRTEEIIPIIEIAMDHGDDKETIRHSLHSSGYSQKDVQEAFERLNVH